MDSYIPTCGVYKKTTKPMREWSRCTKKLAIVWIHANTYNEISGNFAQIVDPQASGNIITEQNALNVIFINNCRHKKSS